MHASAFNCYLVIRTSENRIEFADIDPNAGLVGLIGLSRIWIVRVVWIIRIIWVVIHAVQVKLLRLPRIAVLGKTIGIGSSPECLLTDEAGHLMVAVPVSRCSRESRDDDFRAKVTDDAHEISEDLIMIPLRVRVIRAFRKTKLVVRRKKLLRMIQTARGHQFFRTNDSECFKQLASNEVHSTFTPGGGQVRRPHTLAPCKPCQERTVFIIGMSAGMKHTRDDVQTFQCLGQAHGAPVFGNFGRRHCRGQDRKGEGETQQHNRHYSHNESLVTVNGIVLVSPRTDHAKPMFSTPQLYWVGPDGQENCLPLEAGEILIGRKGDADVVLNNQHVSRHHAKLVKTADGYFLQDLGSTHGTFVNETRVEQHALRHGDKISLGKDRIDLHYIIGEAKPSKPRRADTTKIFERSLIDLGVVLPSEVSDLEKISCILDFQYQWETLFTPEAAFQKILESALKISGAERGFILVRDNQDFGYAAGMDGKGHTLSQSHFKTSHTVVNDVVKHTSAVFRVEGLDNRYREQASIVAMNLRAIACLPLMGIPSQADTPSILGILYLDSTKRMHSLSVLDEKILNKLAVEAGNVLERVEMIKSIEQRKKLELELTLAEETQRTLLPQTFPKVQNLNLHAFSKPTRYVGGDFYDFVELETGELAGVLADVSGKGISASLLSSMLLGCLQMQLRAGLPIDEAINRLNRFLCEKSSSSRFVTMFLFTLSSEGSGRFISAGHNPTYLFRAATGEIEEIGSNNMIVGAFSFVSYQSNVLQLHKGDVLVVYSDGLTEAENPQGEMLGEERVKAIIRAEAPSGSKNLKGKLLEGIQNFTMGRSQTDDITIVIVERV